MHISNGIIQFENQLLNNAVMVTNLEDILIYIIPHLIGFLGFLMCILCIIPYCLPCFLSCFIQKFVYLLIRVIRNIISIIYKLLWCLCIKKKEDINDSEKDIDMDWTNDKQEKLIAA